MIYKNKLQKEIDLVMGYIKSVASYFLWHSKLISIQSLSGIIVKTMILGFFLPAAQGTSQDSLKLHAGGALRFNYNLSSWNPQQVSRGGDFGFDMFRVNINARYNKLKFNTEYRLYSPEFGGGMLKQGWIEYSPNLENTFQLGLTQVPFGIQQYNSHNWFFNIRYYVGLEDDHDIGIKYIFNKKRFEPQIGYFENAEELRIGNNSPHSYSRYSYDVTGRNKEIHQGNLKFKYRFGQSGYSKLGISAMYGGLYNLSSKQTGNHNEIALFYETNIQRWNIKLQAATFAINPAYSSQYLKIIEMGAYGAPYDVSEKGSMLTAALSYGIPFDSGFVYTYIDNSCLGYNQAWLGPIWTEAFA